MAQSAVRIDAEDAVYSFFDELGNIIYMSVGYEVHAEVNGYPVIYYKRIGFDPILEDIQ